MLNLCSVLVFFFFAKTSNSCGSLDVDSSAENLSGGQVDDDDAGFDPVFDDEAVVGRVDDWRRRQSASDFDPRPTPQRRVVRSKREPIYANNRFDEDLLSRQLSEFDGDEDPPPPRAWDFPITAGWERGFDEDSNRHYFTHAQSDVRVRNQTPISSHFEYLFPSPF